MIDDAPYEMKFNLSKLFEAVNMPIILRKVNFASNLVSSWVPGWRFPDKLCNLLTLSQ